MRQKILLDPGTTFLDLRSIGVPKATAWRAAARGWYWIGYHEKRELPPPDFAGFVPAVTYRAAWDVARKRFGEWEWYHDELVEDAVFRCLECSGVSTDFAFAWRTCFNRMHDVCRDWRRERLAEITSLWPRLDRPPFADPAVVCGQLADLAGPKVYRKALAGDAGAISILRRLAWTSESSAPAAAANSP